ncbi:hypothetical protein MBLNU230_g2718t1 [Neophaeotheca triangularis]
MPNRQPTEINEKNPIANGSLPKHQSPKIQPRCYSTQDPPSLEAFKTLCSQTTSSDLYPLATTISKNIPIYTGDTIELHDPTLLSAYQDEWHHNLIHGPGVFVVQNFFPPSSIDATITPANATFNQIITDETTANSTNSSSQKGDHFAPTGANARIWNSFNKHCHHSPTSFLPYYSNPLFQLVAEAHLGPSYQLTTQVNIVKPGGAPQTAHRDYHLGFQNPQTVSRWPKAVHAMSALLTLQGAVAHSDMPLESGPTRLLPFSQLFGEGYLAYGRREFREYFEGAWVSLPLRKGDAVFFSPALFHAAGENVTVDVERAANLLQVSSAFGRAMESVDSLPLVAKTWEGLRDLYGRLGWAPEVRAFVANVAQGYPFPTNLDRRPPAPGGMAPESEQDVLRKGLQEGWGMERVVGELTAMREASRA